MFEEAKAANLASTARLAKEGTEDREEKATNGKIAHRHEASDRRRTVRVGFAYSCTDHCMGGDPADSRALTRYTSVIDRNR